MEQFKLQQDAFEEVKKKIFIRTVPLSLLAAFSGIGISYFNNQGQVYDLTFF
jgi:hypothetical protein